jgi:hypothetical protein
MWSEHVYEIQLISPEVFTVSNTLYSVRLLTQSRVCIPGPPLTTPYLTCPPFHI